MDARLALTTSALACLLAAPARSQPRRDAGRAPPVHAGDAAAPRAAFVPPGPCVQLPNPTWRVSRTSRQSSPVDDERPFEHHSEVLMGTTRPFDLDGDGQLDVLVPEPSRGDCNGDFHFAVYLARGACGHRLGVVHGTLDVAALRAAPRAAGLPELTTRAERGEQPDPRVPAALRSVTRTYRFDGAAYREVGNAVRVAVCHHCGIVRCESALEPAPPARAAGP